MSLLINLHPQHEVSLFMPRQSIWQRLSSIMKAPPEEYKFPFEIFLPLILVLPIAAIFQPLVAFICFVALLFCYVMQIIATREEEQRSLIGNIAFPPAKASNFDYSDPIGLHSRV
jgi:hypothetical protein